MYNIASLVHMLLKQVSLKGMIEALNMGFGTFVVELQGFYIAEDSCTHTKLNSVKSFKCVSLEMWAHCLEGKCFGLLERFA